MENGSRTKIAARTAAEVGNQVRLGDAAKALLRNDLVPRAYLDLLVEKELYHDAARFLARALPKREAVWWACVCARQVAGANPPEPVANAIQAASRWVADPSEDNRRAAQTPGEKAQLCTPAGCAAMAAFWSGGSMAPPNVPAVPPADHLAAHAVTGAIILAAVLTEPEKAPEKFRVFLTRGLEVAEGANGWQQGTAPASARPC
jgi:hypothetical protein